MDLPRIWKTLVCIAASISMVLCTVSMQVAASPAGDGRGPVTMVDQGPPIPTDPDAEPDAPYSPGEMMELGITDVTALEPMVLAAYPSYTSSQIAKNSSGLWYVIATGTYLNKWVTVDGNYRYYQNGVLQTGWKQLPATNEADAGVFWFYLGADGNMRTGWIYVSEDDVYYYLKPSTGIMAAAEWVKVNGYWYYFQADGGMEHSGWFFMKAVLYYLYPVQTTTNGITYPEGSMAVGGHYLPRSDEPTIKRNFYFAESGAKQVWPYPLDTSVTQNTRLSRNIRYTSSHAYNDHQGVDIISTAGAAIKNVAAGKAECVGYFNTTGHTIIISTSATNLSPTLYIRYFHMQSRSSAISKNQEVAREALIGYVGNTGTASTGTHLHLDISPVQAFNVNGPLDLSPWDALNPLAFFALNENAYEIQNGILFGPDMN